VGVSVGVGVGVSSGVVGTIRKLPSTLGPPQTPESPQFCELIENSTMASGPGAGGMVTWRLKGKLTAWPERRPLTPWGGHDADFGSPPVTDRPADIERFVTPPAYKTLPDTVTVAPVTVPDR
jgi:hypothetical protein